MRQLKATGTKLLGVARELFSLPPGRAFANLRSRAKNAWCRSSERLVLALASDPLDLAQPLPTGFLDSFLARPPLLPGARDFEALRHRLSQRYSAAVEELVLDAECICRREFELLGSGAARFSSEAGSIDWQLDPVSGFRWPPGAYWRDALETTGPGADVKLPWELSRFQHLPRLGLAFRLTGRKEFAREAAVQLSDWMEQNTPLLGIDWACAMEVAIRAVNWLVAFDYFRGSDPFDRPLLERALRNLRAHGRYVLRHLEWTPALRSNHYLANLVGLFVLGHGLEGVPEACSWAETARRELERTIAEQVYSDGLFFEGSIPYHRLATELYALPLLIAKNLNRPLSVAYAARLRSMFEAVRGYLKPDGSAPQVGDNDSGRLLRFFPRPCLQHAYLADLGTALLGPTGPDPVGPRLDPEVAGWVGLGEAEPATSQVAAARSRAFEEFGLYVWHAGHAYVAISCGPVGQNGIGGHGHNDKLSFELSLGARHLVVDPGSFGYTRDRAARDLFRSTACHNTLQVDGEEQNRILPDATFQLPDDTQARCTFWRASEDEFEFHGLHRGYRRLEMPAAHERRIRGWGSPFKLEIVDSVDTAGDRPPLIRALDWAFHLAPGVTARASATEALLLAGKERLCLRETETGLQPLIEAYGYSPSYGVQVEAAVVRFKTQSML
ncbi:MAG: alginate lyase family protein, partial [Candidatus Wallbacteria bacterium]|nr:alginate lyase family protein [Candidatus Wallbacteria bacterium]